MRARSLILGVLLAAIVPIGCAHAEVIDPAHDPFYVAPDGIGDLALGSVIRSREVDVTLEGAPITGNGNRAYQLLYRTGDVADRPVANVTTVIVPVDAPATGRQLVSLQDAEDSLDSNCAPSYQLRVGQSAPSGARDGNLAAELSGLLPQLAAGRVLLVPDAEGPDNEYIVRLSNAHMVLDSIRAAESFGPAGLDGAATPVALFGYSGGAWESAAANELQPTYAPELNVVAVAAGGVPVGNSANFRFIDGSLTTGVLMAVSQAINHAYPDLDLFSLLNDAGRAFAKTVQTGCASSVFAAPLAHFDDWTTAKNAIGLPRVQRIVAENALGHGAPTAPTLYYNAINDEIVWIEPLDELVAEYCAAGSPILYMRDPAGAEHIQGAANFIPIANAYFETRFGGAPVQRSCGLPLNAVP